MKSKKFLVRQLHRKQISIKISSWFCSSFLTQIVLIINFYDNFMNKLREVSYKKWLKTSLKSITLQLKQKVNFFPTDSGCCIYIESFYINIHIKWSSRELRRRIFLCIIRYSKALYNRTAFFDVSKANKKINGCAFMIFFATKIEINWFW